MLKWISFFSFFVLLAFFSCKHKPFEELLEENPNNNSDTAVNDHPCDPDTAYFSKDIFPILQSNCAYSGCHGDGSAQKGVDLTTYLSIINTADVNAFDPDGSELFERITETDPDERMPPPPNNPLTADQINMIRLWINQGAKDNSCDGCDTSMVTFSASIQPLIANKCQGCHSGGSPQGGISLTNYSEISAQANNGALFGAVNHEAGFTPMPFNGNKLPQCEIDQIAKWIADGAPEN